MHPRLIIGAAFTLLLVALLGTSLYVALQNQEIRQQAREEKAYLQLASAEPKNHGRAQYSVVVNGLDPDFEYRLVHEIRYDKSSGLHKTGRIAENKTYKFHIPYPGCDTKAKIKVMLYSRAPNEVWKKGGNEAEDELKFTCPETPAPLPSTTATPQPSFPTSPHPPAAVPTPAVFPADIPQVSPDVLGISGLADVDPEAINVESLEDFSVIENESLLVRSAPASPPLHPGTVFQIKSGADDVNEDGNHFDVSAKTVWMGDGESGGKNYLGLRFTRITIPQGSRITSAILDLYNESQAWINMDFTIFADATDDSAPFSPAAKPGQRLLTVQGFEHHSDSNWKTPGWQQFGDISKVISEVVSRPGWKSGNSLTLVIKGSGRQWGRKFLRSFEADPRTAPRLTVDFTIASPDMAPAPAVVTPTPPVNSTPTLFPTPAISPPPGSSLLPGISPRTTASPDPHPSPGGGFGSLLPSTTPQPAASPSPSGGAYSVYDLKTRLQNYLGTENPGGIPRDGKMNILEIVNLIPLITH